MSVKVREPGIIERGQAIPADVASMRHDERSDVSLPESPLVRVAALTARVLEARAAVLTVAPRGADNAAVSIQVDRDGASVERGHAPRVRTSAEVPLVGSGGAVLGSLGVRDREARTLTAEELKTLSDLGRIVADEVELEQEARRERAMNESRIEEELQAAQDVANVASAVRGFSALEEPEAVRRAICDIALQFTGADSASILSEVGDDIRLVQSSSAGMPWRIHDTVLSDEASPPAVAYRAGKAVFQPPDDAPDPGPMVALWQPFPAGGRSSAAVLALAWRGPLAIEPPRLMSLTELIVAETTTVLERADLLAQLAGLARTDELTGLPNRRAIDEVLAHEMERARRQRSPLCAALLDLDLFKQFNDTHGHAAGDALLAEAAAEWQECLRAGTDTIGRYGGEEFLVVLPAPPDGAVATVDRLRRLTPRDQTASAGVASWDGTESAADLIARADIALYAAKARGRNRSEMAMRPADGPQAEGRLVGVFRRDEATPRP
jgi:diguanylate cyclase (GGDEF)-like protein